MVVIFNLKMLSDIIEYLLFIRLKVSERIFTTKNLTKLIWEIISLKF
ncbi:MAG: hypothetical protein ACI9SD_001405 [Pseudohongiellaceae bacterium]|jgi:hypothetical protein